MEGVSWRWRWSRSQWRQRQSPSHLHLLHHILHIHHVDVLDALRLELRPPLLDELFPHLLAELVRGQGAIRVVLLAPLGTDALGDLLASAALRKLAQDEGEALGEVRLADAGHG